MLTIAKTACHFRLYSSELCTDNKVILRCSFNLLETFNFICCLKYQTHKISFVFANSDTDCDLSLFLSSKLLFKS